MIEEETNADILVTAQDIANAWMFLLIDWCVVTKTNPDVLEDLARQMMDTQGLMPDSARAKTILRATADNLMRTEPGALPN